MELRPADLGDAYQTALVLRRVRKAAPLAITQSARDKRMSRRPGWVQKLQIAEGVEAETLPAVVRAMRPLRYAVGGFASLAMAASWAAPETLALHLGMTALFGGMFYLAADVLPGMEAQSLYKKAITENEIRRLQSATSETSAAAAAPTIKLDDSPFSALLEHFLTPRHKRRAESAATLESDYFDLILAAMKTPVPESSVELELRATLRQIGMAVANVRRSEVAEDNADAADLIGDAEILAARARSEGDRIVAASLLRQAQAKVAQAKIVERNVVLRRRTRALGAELRAQIAAAQSSLRNLSSQGMMNAESGGAFRIIADSVRTLSVEADSVAQAHDELAVALGAAAPTPTANQTASTGTTARTPTYVSTPSGEVQAVSNRRGG